jgi:hypothetical protein
MGKKKNIAKFIIILEADETKRDQVPAFFRFYIERGLSVVRILRLEEKSKMDL